MKQFKTGFIGCGNMAAAIINGIIEKQLVDTGNLCIYDIDTAKTREYREIELCASISELAQNSQIIFLCVKPNVIAQAAQEITQADKAFVSIAAGVTTHTLVNILPDNSRIARVMPNTPLMVGKGAVCIQTPHTLTAEEQTFIYHIFSELGQLFEVTEDQMDAVTGVSGSGPAYVYHFIDALAKAGEANGLSYELSLQLAAQTFSGACEMLKTTGKPPEQLICDVCSPGGTTEQGMRVLREKDVCSTVRQAVDASVKRSRELSQ